VAFRKIAETNSARLEDWDLRLAAGVAHQGHDVLGEPGENLLRLEEWDDRGGNSDHRLITFRELFGR